MSDFPTDEERQAVLSVWEARAALEVEATPAEHIEVLLEALHPFIDDREEQAYGRGKDDEASQG